MNNGLKVLRMTQREARTPSVVGKQDWLEYR